MSMPKNGGFTLVELVVVIAILAILAGITVPAYSGYIRKAEEAADLVVCEAVELAVFAAYLQEGEEAPETITISNGQVTGLSDPYLTSYSFYIGATEIPEDLSATWSRDTSSWTIDPVE